jgi:S1-C subfamily serine protease
MIVLIAAIVLGGSDTAKQLKDVADRLHDTVVEVRATGGVVPLYGTGVLIGGGLALTTLHTVSGGGAVEVLVQGGAAPLAAKLVGGFPQIDLAVLHLDGASSLPSVPLAEQAPVVGDALIAMGADEDTVDAVGVNVAAVNGDLLVLASTRRVDSRFWGGPIFDTQGRLVAIALSTIALPGAITASALRSLLQQAATR